jgi:hypothetical protein
MSREILVAIHAGSGIVGLIVGLAVFSPSPANERRSRIWRIVYAGLLVVLTVSLLALIVTDWASLETGSRLAFSGLAILAGVMLGRIYLAHRLAGSRIAGWERGYVSHVYFTYVSLWVGFAIIPALRSPAPGLWIPIAVIGVLAAGNVLVHRYERRIGLEPTL